MNSAVRSVAWNHVKPNLGAAGLFNGQIVIIDADNYVKT